MQIMMNTREGDFGSFIAMVVRDAEKMLGFYQNVLGMKLTSCRVPSKMRLASQAEWD